MKLRLLLALVGLVFSFALPTFAQQKKNTSVSEQDRQQIEASIVKKLEEACNKNDAAAVAAVFTEDAVQVAPEGLFSGRQAIENIGGEHVGPGGVRLQEKSIGGRRGAFPHCHPRGNPKERGLSQRVSTRPFERVTGFL
jgi:hypothetical protein